MIIEKNYKRSDLSIVQKCKVGETVCGDSYLTIETEEHLILTIVDGLGSGTQAKKAADKAVQCFLQHQHLEVKEMMLLCNKELLHTRGAVAGIAKLDFSTSQMTFAGIGNIHFLLCPAEDKTIRPLSKPGYLSGRPIQVIQQQFYYPVGTPFMMYSDGLDIKQTLEHKIRASNNLQIWSAQLMEQLGGSQDDLTFILGKANY